MPVRNKKILSLARCKPNISRKILDAWKVLSVKEQDKGLTIQEKQLQKQVIRL